jgi:hypothetical protein
MPQQFFFEYNKNTSASSYIVELLLHSPVLMSDLTKLEAIGWAIKAAACFV